MIDHYALTVVLPIDPAKKGLEAFLEQIDDSLWNGKNAPLVAFANVPAVHFARWVILPTHRQDLDEGTYAPMLAFTSSFADDKGLGFEGACKQHLTDLLRDTGPAFDQVFQHCTGYHEAADKVAFLTDRERLVAPGTFYTGSRWRTTERICEEQRIRMDIEAAADAVLSNRPPSDIGALRDAIANRVAKPTPLDPFPTPWPFDKIKQVALPALVAVAVVLLAGFVAALLALSRSWAQLAPVVRGVLLFYVGVVLLLLALVAAVAVGYAILREKEKTDPELDYSKLPPGYLGDVAKVSQREDRGGVQNQLTHIVEIKPGPFRLLLLRAVLWAIDLLARKVFTRGDLGGIPSIHFAHWVIIGGGKRLLFFSNFDNSWESYLGEFVDQAAQGLTAVWSNTRLYPRSENLLDKGATDETRFKTWTRLLQIRTQVWYSAYPHISIRNVNDNSAIVRGLIDRGAAPDRQWLRSL